MTRQLCDSNDSVEKLKNFLISDFYVKSILENSGWNWLFWNKIAIGALNFLILVNLCTLGTPKSQIGTLGILNSTKLISRKKEFLRENLKFSHCGRQKWKSFCVRFTHISHRFLWYVRLPKEITYSTNLNFHFLELWSQIQTPT